MTRKRAIDVFCYLCEDWMLFSLVACENDFLCSEALAPDEFDIFRSYFIFSFFMLSNAAHN